MLPIGHFGYPIGRNSNSIGRFRNSIGQNRDSYGQARDPIGIYPALMDNLHAYWNLSRPNGQSPRPWKKPSVLRHYRLCPCPFHWSESAKFV